MPRAKPVLADSLGWTLYEIVGAGRYLTRKQDDDNRVVPLPVDVEDDSALEPLVLEQLCRRLDIPPEIFGLDMTPPEETN